VPMIVIHAADLLEDTLTRSGCCNASDIDEDQVKGFGVAD